MTPWVHFMRNVQWCGEPSFSIQDMEDSNYPWYIPVECSVSTGQGFGTGLTFLALCGSPSVSSQTNSGDRLMTRRLSSWLTCCAQEMEHFYTCHFKINDIWIAIASSTIQIDQVRLTNMKRHEALQVQPTSWDQIGISSEAPLTHANRCVGGSSYSFATCGRDHISLRNPHKCTTALWNIELISKPISYLSNFSELTNHRSARRRKSPRRVVVWSLEGSTELFDSKPIVSPA